MNSRTLIILGLFIVAVGLTAALSRNETVAAEGNVGQPLMPGLDEKLNEVDKVVLRGTTGVVTLSRTGDDWGVVERDGYSADFADLTELMTTLARAKYTERKTARAENLSRMGLLDVGADESKSVVVEIQAGTDNHVVMLGDRASGRTGQYVRFPPDTQVWEIDQYANVEEGPENWIESTVLNVTSDRVERVVVNHADGESIEVVRRDGEFRFDALAEGEELKYSTVSSELARALVNLRITDVVLDASVDWAQAATANYVCTDGLVVTSRVVENDGKYFLRLDASTSQEAQDVSAEVKAEAEKIAAKSKWQFEIAQFTYTDLSKRRVDLLKPAAEPESSEAEG